MKRRHRVRPEDPYAHADDDPFDYAQRIGAKLAVHARLQDNRTGTWGVWYLDEVVPVNCPAQELVAKLLLWKRKEAAFKLWRKEKRNGGAKPLKKCFGNIRRKIRNWMKQV